ncbi:hypothetical protein AAC387_Pa07g3094 [Persea americana]
MATNIIPIISILYILSMATQLPITPTSANVLRSDQISYNSPPPPGECPYPCLPPPTSTSPNCPPPPPSPPHSGSYYPPPSPGNVYYYPPPSPGNVYYYPPPSGSFPYIPPPNVNFPAPPPPNPILPYFPFYYKQPLQSTSLSSPLHHNGATAFVILMLLLLGFCLS